MGLFQPGWMSKDEKKAMRSLEKVSGDAALFKVVTECPHPSVQMLALSRIKDEGRRLDVVLTKQLLSFDLRRAALHGISEEGLQQAAKKAPTCELRLEAVQRMKDETGLAAIVMELAEGNRDDRRVSEAAYEKMTHPPFSCSMIIHHRRTDENLLYDLEKMTYPEDREKILRIANEKDGRCAEKAVMFLPYEKEREELRQLAMGGKRNARLAAINSLHVPEDRDLLDAILNDPKSDLALKKLTARMLPGNDPMLERRCCPFCGAYDSVVHHGGYDDSADMYYSAWQCRACGHEDRKHSVTGSGQAKDFSVTLRDLSLK